LRVANADFLGIVATNQFLEKLPQWMRFGNHLLGPPEIRVAHGLPTLLGNCYPSHSTKASDFCLSSASFLLMIRGLDPQLGLPSNFCWHTRFMAANAIALAANKMKLIGKD
jgi:hypothetical protein